MQLCLPTSDNIFAIHSQQMPRDRVNLKLEFNVILDYYTNLSKLLELNLSTLWDVPYLGLFSSSSTTFCFR